MSHFVRALVFVLLSGKCWTPLLDDFYQWKACLRSLAFEFQLLAIDVEQWFL